jgi:hypothetical protein
VISLQLAQSGELLQAAFENREEGADVAAGVTVGERGKDGSRFLRHALQRRGFLAAAMFAGLVFGLAYQAFLDADPPELGNFDIPSSAAPASAPKRNPVAIDGAPSIHARVEGSTLERRSEALCLSVGCSQPPGRLAIADKAEAGEAEAQERPGRGLGNRRGDGGQAHPSLWGAQTADIASACRLLSAVRLFSKDDLSHAADLDFEIWTSRGSCRQRGA